MNAKIRFHDLSPSLTEPEILALLDLMWRGEVECVDQADIADVLRHTADIADPSAAKVSAIRVVAELLGRNWMTGGTLGGGKFEPWSKAEAMAVLQTEWPNDQFPNLGEINFYLSLTDAGRSCVQEARVAGLLKRIADE